jgi:hypothetical protein
MTSSERDRRRDGGGNRRGSRRALNQRWSGDRHPLWGLSDAGDCRRIGERELELVVRRRARNLIR